MCPTLAVCLTLDGSLFWMLGVRNLGGGSFWGLVWYDLSVRCTTGLAEYPMLIDVDRPWVFSGRNAGITPIRN